MIDSNLGAEKSAPIFMPGTRYHLQMYHQSAKFPHRQKSIILKLEKMSLWKEWNRCEYRVGKHKKDIDDKQSDFGLPKILCKHSNLIVTFTTDFFYCKKALLQAMVSYIEINPNKRADGHMLKTIHFTFPVTYDGESGAIFVRSNDSTVESVILLQQKT